MSLQEQVIPISFASGIQTKVDPKQIDAGQLLELQNGVFTSPKEIRKRHGYLTLSNEIFGPSNQTTTYITQGNSLGTLNDSLVLTDSIGVYSYLEDNSSWHFAGYKTNTKVSSADVIGNSNADFYPASLTYNTIKMTLGGALGDNTQYQVVLTDPISGNVMFNQTLGTAAGNPLTTVQMTKGSNGLFVQMIQDSTGNIYLYTYNPSTFFRQQQVVITGADVTGAKVASDSTAVYLLYAESNVINVHKYNINTFSFLSTATVTTASSAVASLDLICDATNNELIIFYALGFFGAVTRYSSTTMLLIGLIYDTGATSSSVRNITGVIDQTALFIAYDSLSITDNINFFTTSLVMRSYRSPSVTQLSLPNSAYGSNIYSNPVVINNVIYLAKMSMLPTQNNQYLVGYVSSLPDPSDPANFWKPIIAGRFAYQSSYFDAVNFNTGGLVGTVQWDGQMLPFLIAEHTSITAGVITASYGVALLSLTLDQKLTNVTLGDNINYVGGMPSIFDNNSVAEMGYNLFPVIKPFPVLTGSFNFSYTAIYIWVDFEGNLHRSAEALPAPLIQSNDISPTNAVTINITGYGLGETYKTQNVIVELYRTVGTSGGGTVYYLVGTAANNPFGFVTITDTTTSDILTGNQQLYTNGGEVENIAPPATNLMTSFKNRIILVDAENPLQWWFSKQIIQGFPAEFSDVLTQNIDQKGGPITALSTMDDKLIFFKESNVWYIIGDGPSPNGQNNDFTYPQIISSDTGCVNQDSIVLTPDGIFFQSPKGIYLLDRKLGLTYVGASVERYNSSNVTSAQMIAGTNQIRFSLDSGIVLVYDYFIQQWATFTNIAANDAVIYKGNYTYLTLAGTVNEETPGAWVDPSNTTIPLSLTTGWLSMAGLQGFERVKQLLILGESESVTTLSVKLAYDFDSTIAQTNNISVAVAKIPMQYRVFMARQKCQAIQITLSDAPTSPTEGLRLSALALNIAAKKGPYKKSAALTYG